VTDLGLVLSAVDRLRSDGVRTWVCGGWADELRGLTPPRPHADLDLLYPARDWRRVDSLELEWVEGRRVPWKRAFTFEGSVVELYLVERDDRGWYTRRAHRRHDWPDDVFATCGRLPVASTAALTSFRRTHRRAA
jgi:aminoglycoside-2''-adenylyltransferase